MFKTSEGYPGKNDLVMELDLYTWSCKKKLGLLVAELSVDSSMLALTGSLPASIRINPRWFKSRGINNRSPGEGNKPGK